MSPRSRDSCRQCPTPWASGRSERSHSARHRYPASSYAAMSDRDRRDGDRSPASVALERKPPKPPTLLDALLPIGVLIGLIATTIAIFGVGATDGPMQIALFLSAAFASLIAFKNGYTVASVADAAVGGVTTAVGAIFILLAVGALMGTWNMAGTIPTVVHYGIGLLTPTLFFVATAAICALVGMVTGSSWTTAGTLGVAFVGMATVLGLPEAVAAGAVLS